MYGSGGYGVSMFFFKQKPAYDCRISDWSSDVCSSDLPRARVLALSAHDDPMHARRALREGALGSLSKRSAPEALIEALAAVAAGRRYIDPDVAQKLALEEVGAGAKSPIERLR